MRRFLLFALFATLAMGTEELAAQTHEGSVKPLPALNVKGRWLVDKHNNHVVLHGVMDTPNMYFNGWRWGSPWETGTNYDANGATKCLAYFDKLFVGMEKAKCDVFRLHLDPAWTNDPNKKSDGKEQGEADISCFSPERLKTFLKSLYLPLAQKAMNHGMYVVVRPPGVCPGNLKVGDYYNDYLMTVWDIFSSNDSVKKYAGQISIELANEPVAVKNVNGQDDPKALHDFFQPVVDKIRQNGFTGIIWVPGTDWQANYTSYATYPIEGDNIGYAVHDYCGWYGSSDDSPSPENKISQFRKQVPVVDTAPIIITEVDWSPYKPGTGHYNEHGNWVESNYGTWATGSTSKWGKAFKACLDYYGNISMTLSGTGCLFDIDRLLSDGSVVPAFGGLEEACGKACMDWYADYFKVDWAHADEDAPADEALQAESISLGSEQMELGVGSSGLVRLYATFRDGHQRDVTDEAAYTVSGSNGVTVSKGVVHAMTDGSAEVTAVYTDPKGNTLSASFHVRSTYFPFASQCINPSLFANGTYTESTRTFRPGQWGQMGWEYQDGVDLSGYKYLVIKLKQTQNCDAHLNIFTAPSIWSDGFESEGFGSKTQIVINLSTAKTKNGSPLDTKNVRIVSFWGNGNGTIVVDDIYLTNNSDYSPEQSSGIRTATLDDNGMVDVYSLSGVPVRRNVERGSALQGLPAGLYLMGGRKFIVSLIM